MSDKIDEIPEWAFEFAKMTHVDSSWIRLLYALALDTKDTGVAVQTWKQQER